MVVQPTSTKLIQSSHRPVHWNFLAVTFDGLRIGRWDEDGWDAWERKGDRSQGQVAAVAVAGTGCAPCTSLALRWDVGTVGGGGYGEMGLNYVGTVTSGDSRADPRKSSILRLRPRLFSHLYGE